MKRLLSLTLTLAISLSLVLPALAAAPSLYSTLAYAQNSSWRSLNFAVPGDNRSSICVTFSNATGEAVRVYVRNARSNERCETMMEVEANSEQSMIFTTGAGTYYVVAEAYVAGGHIDGDLTVDLVESKAKAEKPLLTNVKLG